MIRVDKLERQTVPGQQKITVYTHDIREVDRMISKAGKKPLELIIRPIRHKRSVDANAYMWVLCDKIARVIRSTKEEVYREHIMSRGRFRDAAVAMGAPTQELVEWWEHRGDGWIAEIRPDCDIQGHNKVRLYKGSSVYDTKEFAYLLDGIVEEAKAFGIETATPDEIARLKAYGMDQT